MIPHVVVERCPADVKGSSEIGLDHRLEAVGGQLLGGADELTPGIIDEHVKRAVIFDDEFHLFSPHEYMQNVIVWYGRKRYHEKNDDC